MSNHDGFTLVEVLVAVAIIGFALVAIAMGFGIATSGVEAGRQQTMATMLAEQRVEVLRSQVLANFADPQVAAGTTQEAYGSIPNAASYRRQTIIADVDPDADGVVDLKRIQIDVFYRSIVDPNAVPTERQVSLVNIVSRRQ
jgi:prepilin-type N-terminal cleavage/methylation domain-containing protein